MYNDALVMNAFIFKPILILGCLFLFSLFVRTGGKK